MSNKVKLLKSGNIAVTTYCKGKATHIVLVGWNIEEARMKYLY